MGLPVGADFIFGTDVDKAVPPYSVEDLSTVVYENTPMASAPESLGGVMLKLVIDSDDTEVEISHVNVDSSLPASSRIVDWGDGTVETLGGSGLCGHRYQVAGTYYVRFNDCLIEIAVCSQYSDEGSGVANMAAALRHVKFPDKVTRLMPGCFRNAVNLEQEVLVFPGVRDLSAYVLGRVGADTNAVRVLSVPSARLLGTYSFFPSFPSVEVICMDGVDGTTNDLWDRCPNLKWLLMRRKTCSRIQSEFSGLFDTTQVEGRGIVGSDGYIMNKTIYYDN